MKKRYTITYDWTFDMVVEIDHDVMTDEKLHEINNFWSNNLTRLQRADGDVTKAVLAMLGLTAFSMWVSENAEYTLKYQGVEGWPKLDGSEGILLVSLDTFEFDEDDITIKMEEV